MPTTTSMIALSCVYVGRNRNRNGNGIIVLWHFGSRSRSWVYFWVDACSGTLCRHKNRNGNGIIVSEPSKTCSSRIFGAHFRSFFIFLKIAIVAIFVFQNRERRLFRYIEQIQQYSLFKVIFCWWWEKHIGVKNFKIGRLVHDLQFFTLLHLNIYKPSPLAKNNHNKRLDDIAQNFRRFQPISMSKLSFIS